MEDPRPPQLPSANPFTASQMTSLRGVSPSKLQAAIHSPHDPGATLKRVNAILALYFVPDEDMETKASVREEFLRALASYPDWAVQQAFDTWARNRTRRPSPGEIVIEVGAAMRPITDEISRRQREAERQEPPREVVDKDRADEIMARAGFTPRRMDAVRKAPMARTIEQAEAIADAPPVPHWTETVADPENDPRMIALRASRAASTVVKPAPMVVAAADADRQRMQGERGDAA